MIMSADGIDPSRGKAQEGRPREIAEHFVQSITRYNPNGNEQDAILKQMRNSAAKYDSASAMTCDVCHKKMEEKPKKCSKVQ